MTQREVYPNAPIVLAAVEVRHAPCPALSASERAMLSRLFRDEVPVFGEVKSLEVQMHAPGASPAPSSVAHEPRWTSRDRRTAIALRRDAIVVESTDYRGFDRLRHLCELALTGRTRVTTPDGVERIGLRYVDEIRAPISGQHPDVHDWEQWIHPSLLGATLDIPGSDLRAVSTQGASLFRSEDSTFVLRYGPREGFATSSNSDLRRPLGTPGPFFLIDMDSFWEADLVSHWDVERILEWIDKLHRPIRSAFESSITEQLRREVLRNG